MVNREVKVSGFQKLLSIVLLCKENKHPTAKMTMLIGNKNKHFRTYKDRPGSIFLFEKVLECKQGCLSEK